MCGIAGAVGLIDRQIVDGVERASLSQKSRGPDASGSWSSESSGLEEYRGGYFSHRRLSIIDLHARADQPFEDKHTGNVVVFNGEIYNYRVLMSELRAAGVSFETESDTEVLLKSYARWGVDFVHKLRGMFAFAIWDKRRGSCFLVRDRMGIKPLYYIDLSAENMGRQAIVFASQVRALLASDLFTRSLDPVGLSSFLWNGFVVGPGTLLKGVRQVPPGHMIEIDRSGSTTLTQYWDIPKSSTTGSLEEVQASLETSVAQHLASDVPLGLFLSGGKDSSAIATMASRVSDDPVKTFTITFEEERYNEAKYARRVADAIGSDHREVLLTESTFISGLEGALESLDQPTFDGINSYMVSRAVKEAGITVALAGTGGDELFGGYRSFRDLPRIQVACSLLGHMPEILTSPVSDLLSRIVTRNFSSVPPQTNWGRMGDAIKTRGQMHQLYQVSSALFTQKFLNKLQMEPCDQTVWGLPNEMLVSLARKVAGEGPLNSISILESTLFLGERLLRDTDAASMESSLEVRVPLVDHEVVESLFRLDERTRFHPAREKPLLRKLAMWDLPDEIFDRPKLGFELPLDVWCKQGLAEEMSDCLYDAALCESVNLEPSAVSELWNAFSRNVRGLYWSRVWSLFVLLWWCKRYSVSI